MTTGGLSELHGELKGRADFFQALSRRLHAPELPIYHRILGNPDERSKFLDHKMPVHSGFADMFSKCLWLFRISRIKLDEIKADFEGVEGLRKVVFL